MTFNAAYPQYLLLLPPNLNLEDKEIINLILQARVELAELKGYTSSLTNPLLLLSPAIIKESIASSEIENINTTVLNILENQLFPEDEQSPPDKEVLRYREAILWGYAQLEKEPISSKLIQGIHNRLMPDLGGGFRTAANAIQNSKTKQVIYTPPVQSKIPELIGNLENYINHQVPKNANGIDPLINAAISHYQFEAIHPFSDGNGRTGRILMVLQLINENVLFLPTLYISGYINQNKSEYYHLLLEVTSKNKWREYILFMLKGFYEQAKETKLFALKIKNLYFDLKQELKEKNQKIYSADLLDALFSFPIITPVKLGTELNVHYGTASRYLIQLEKTGVLQSKWVGKYHFFANKKLLNVLHGQDVYQ